MTLDYLTEILPAHSVLRAWDTQSCTCDSSVTPFFQGPLLPRRMLQEASGPRDGHEIAHVCYTVLPSRNDWAKGPHYSPIVADEKAVPVMTDLHNFPQPGRGGTQAVTIPYFQDVNAIGPSQVHHQDLLQHQASHIISATTP